MAKTPLLAEIRKRTDGLQRHCDLLLRCRVSVEAPSSRHRQGQRYNVTVHMALPGTYLVANRKPDHHTEHEDVSLALRDGFRAAVRELDKWSDLRRDWPERRQYRP